ncbi:MAG TPA: type I DNA topoisomerase [Candidatus Acidoferrales bacterium]|nr:type I DNA topoisomerase [Candidatus Acidoferrales bacterium]
MAKKLVIVESPAKAKTINRYLGSDFVVEASVGHIKDLPKSKLGVDIERGFEPEYKTIRGKSETIKKLKDLSEKAQQVYIATDPDREGEAIAQHIAEELKQDSDKVFRVLFTEITESGISKAMENPLKIDSHLVYAQQARRVMDRLVGYKVSPLIWKAVYPGLSAGRVQSVALKLVCERENEIKDFLPIEHWSILGKFRTVEDPSHGKKAEEFEAKLYSIGENDLRDPQGSANSKERDKIFYIKDQESAAKLAQEILGEKYRVASIARKEQKRNPAPPFITSTLQQASSTRLGFSPKRTMMLAQQLYEGVDLGPEGRVGLITYMRTDSTRISEEAINAARSYIKSEFGDEFLPKDARHFKKAKASQDAHEAIRPAHMEYLPQVVKKYLPRETFLLYDLIWKRFVASQMNPVVYDQITVSIEGGKFVFKASDSRVKFAGFLQVYDITAEDADVSRPDEDVDELQKFKLPATLKEGEQVNLEDIFQRQHFTKPPARYTESSLVKELESLGIGRPSTYSAIVSTIEDRGYVELKERKLYATDLGMNVNKILSANLPEFFDVKFTAEMESELDEIAGGNKKYLDVMKEFYSPFDTAVKKVEEKMDEIKSTVDGQQVDCDICGAPMVIKWSRRGRFLACSRYPECKNTKPIDAHDDNNRPTGDKCPECGGDLIYKNSRFGKFIGCSNYPTCKFTKSITTGVKCPECGKGELAQRFTKKKRIFYGCTNYPNCKYATWDKPVNIPCPLGDSPFLLEKYSKAKGNYYKCPKCESEISPEEVSPKNKEDVAAGSNGKIEIAAK